MAETKELPEDLRIEALPEPGDRFTLGDKLGSGVYSHVYEATDAQQGGRRVAVKVVTLTLNVASDVREEYRVLKRLCQHPNLPELFGAFLRRGESRKQADELWFVMELCEGGPVTDLVVGLHRQGRRMREEHIAYILKETTKALVHLHENRIIHRDVKGSNILLTKDGEVKLVDFGLARELVSTLGKSGTCLGSPCWMAPEVVASRDASTYDNRADVWALGIVAIELADGKPPFHDMHPTRALFQIVRNPPPTLFRPANWSQMFNDFIAECLEKNPEHRPYMVELLEHPFLTEFQQNEITLQQELRVLSSDASPAGRKRRAPELAVRGSQLQASHTEPPEDLLVEDVATLDPLTEDSLLHELQERFHRGHAYTFAGDVLIALNPTHQLDVYSPRHHAKYQFKSRSDNAPHIFAVADRALQDALHHEETQHVVLAGESCSGKSTQLRHLLSHFLFLGKSAHDVGEHVERAMGVLDAFGNAATPVHADSTRHLLQLQLTFTRTGKLSGAIFWVSMLEKWRVVGGDSNQANFHALYYFYDGLEADGRLRELGLEPGRAYRYLRRERPSKDEGPGPTGGRGPRDEPRDNVSRFRELQQSLREGLGLEEEAVEGVWAAMAAVLLLGEIDFRGDAAAPDPEAAAMRNPEVAAQVARLLSVDEKKLSWALLNYCVVEQGAAVRRRHSVQQASDARHALASTLFARLVDWLVNAANWRLSFSRAVYGDPHVINVVDLFGFECHRTNGLEQIFVNTMNEQLQYYYNQRIFAWELQEHQEEGLPMPPLRFVDSKATLDSLLARPDGLLPLLDNPELADSQQLLDALRRAGRSPHLTVGAHEFSVAHFTGTVAYSTRDLAKRNRDFLAPDLVDALRHSTDSMVQHLFTGRLSRAGTLTAAEPSAPASSADAAPMAPKRRWGAVLMADTDRCIKKANTASRGKFSQSRGLRTAAGVFRGAGLEALRALTGGGLHPVRCVRTHLGGEPRTLQPELVRQQVRALALFDTARARRDGYPCRVPFAEFIRRYKFLAFDFDENVEETKENSRLLLVRLKMEGWLIGKTKVFLTYYNEEYLARLYETQVKKIVRVQTMLRAFLARRTVQKKTQLLRQQSQDKVQKSREEADKAERCGPLEEESAALIIQKQYRGYKVRKEMGKILQSNDQPMDEETQNFIRQYCRRWRAKTIYQVLLLYRATRHQDLVYFCQQAHLYNQHAVSALQRTTVPAPPEDVDPTVRASTWLGRPRPPVRKLPFRLSYDLPYVDTSQFCEPGFAVLEGADYDQEAWDAPLRRGSALGFSWGARISVRDQEVQTSTSPTPDEERWTADAFLTEPFSRDPQHLEALSQQKRRGPQQLEQKKHSHAAESRPLVYKAGKPQRQAEKDYRDSNHFNGSSRNSQSAVKTSVSSILPHAPLRESQKQDDTSTYNFIKSSEKPEKLYYKERNVPNPIEEMERRGIRSNYTDESDDPPFNFQAMLRKTNPNRASLKRRGNEPKPLNSKPLQVNYTDFDMTGKYHVNVNAKNSSGNNAKQQNSSIYSDNEVSYERTDYSTDKKEKVNSITKVKTESNLSNSFKYTIQNNNISNSSEGETLYSHDKNKNITGFENIEERKKEIESSKRENCSTSQVYQATGNKQITNQYISDEITELVPGIMIQGAQVAEL